MLWRKMWRDMAENKIAYIACTIVIAIGLMTYTSMSMSKDHLFAAKDEFYRHYHFADGFAKVKAMPLSKAKAIKDMEGVDRVNGRLVKEVRVLIPSSDSEDVYLRLISFDETLPHRLNDVELLQGSFPQKNSRQILLADKFLKAHSLGLSDQIDVVIDGKQVGLTVSGSGQSPEYVYALKEAQAIAPDPRTFEVAYLPYEDMEMLFGQKQMVNDVVFTLKPGVKFADVEAKLKSTLKPYQLEALYGANDQLSNAMLSEELKQLEKMAKSMPILFLGVAAIILYIMLKRLVESQRGQIGTLKAFGYRNVEIILHYLSYGLLIGLVGGILGGVLGTALSGLMIDLYQSYFSLPNLAAGFSPEYFLYSLIISTLCSLFASYQGVKGVLGLQPAEAMRPPIPVFTKKNMLENLPGFWQIFTMQGRMALRNATRNKGRSFFTFIGIVFTFSMMACFFSIGNMASEMIMDQFTQVQKQDVKLSFSAPLPRRQAVRELQHVQGVHRVEPMVEVPVSLQFLNHQEDVVALGISNNANLYQVFDKQGERVQIPRTGLMLSVQVAEQLQVKAGDVLEMDSIWAKEKMKVKVERIVPQYIGANVYMNQDTLLGLLKQGDLATSVLLTIDSKQLVPFKDQYSTSKFVGNLEIRQEMIEKYEQLLASSTYTLWIMGVISVITGFAIVYNSSIISLAERKRELASLRVMGMTPREVMEIISVEQWFLGFFGILAGIPIALTMNQVLAKGMSSDLYTLPGTISPEAILQAVLGTIFAIWISQQWVSRKVQKLDLVEVLKERE
ncbi:ABC transporter permease [Ammoniphilus resinae]|uniref:ABC transport system permease protein n=1 Tax=Ammoniphilus resinae TaxID=861532 RepID=A0ABS4GVT4_9BACL|nr:ABC transporter permease [Ammoniphilus resinae]MBP1934378.1 putative ABC transport system permease protein [Ammoniphilus resinae]